MNPVQQLQRMRFYYVYILESLKDKFRYVGFTGNLKGRLEAHNKGLNYSIMLKRPYKLIYFEGCVNYGDAKRRENDLKTTGGRRFLAKRLQEYNN